MAARIRKTHQDDVRAKIQASQIVNRLTKHILGEIEMTSAQVQSARILLDKSVPNLSSVEHGGNEDAPIVHEFKWRD
jgi:hypothetical protein